MNVPQPSEGTTGHSTERPTRARTKPVRVLYEPPKRSCRTTRSSTEGLKKSKDTIELDRAGGNRVVDGETAAAEDDQSVERLKKRTGKENQGGSGS